MNEVETGADAGSARTAIDPEALDRFFVMLGNRLDELAEDEIPAALARLVLLLVGRLGTVGGLDELVERAIAGAAVPGPDGS